MHCTLVARILKKAAILTAPVVLGAAACDPVSTIHVSRADGRPIVCADKKRDTYYTIVEIGKDGSRYIYKWELRTWGGEDHPYIRPLAGREKDFLWMKVYVYCGKFGKPFLVTHSIRPSDLVQKDRNNFYYMVR